MQQKPLYLGLIQEIQGGIGFKHGEGCYRKWKLMCEESICLRLKGNESRYQRVTDYVIRLGVSLMLKLPKFGYNCYVAQHTIRIISIGV